MPSRHRRHEMQVIADNLISPKDQARQKIRRYIARRNQTYRLHPLKSGASNDYRQLYSP